MTGKPILGMTRRRLIVLGIAVFLAGLIIRFPANAAVAWFLPEVPGFEIGTANGTVWQGQLLGVQYRKLEIKRIDWNISAIALVTGSIKAELDARLANGELHATVAHGLGGRTTITGLKGDTSLAIASHIGLMPRDFASGEILLNFQTIELEDGKPVAVEGRGALTGLRNNLMPNVDLGDYEAVLSNSDQGIVGNFRDLQAPVEISGNATLQPDGKYTVTARLRPRPEAPESLKEALKFLGPEDTEGRRQVDLEGRL